MIEHVSFHITLKDSRPRENRHRVYTIFVSEKGGLYSVTLLWGRIGAKKQRKIQVCETLDILNRCIINILKMRLNHGYLLVEKSEYTPSYDILNEFKQDALYSNDQLKMFE